MLYRETNVPNKERQSQNAARFLLLLLGVVAISLISQKSHHFHRWAGELCKTAPVSFVRRFL
jgi:hypothetical protein